MKHQEIGASPIWRATLETLASRWLMQNPHVEEDADGVAARLIARAETVRKYCDLPQARQLDTPRKWETNWKPVEAWDRLAAVLERLEWRAKLVESPRFSPATLASSQAGEQVDTVFVEKSVAEELAARFRAHGLLLPFGWREGAVLILAEELYDISASRMGHPPAREWVDQLSRHPFTHTVLGWPFYPWVLDFVK